MPDYHSPPPIIIAEEPDGDDGMLDIRLSPLNVRRLRAIMSDESFAFLTIDDVIGYLLRIARTNVPKVRWWLDLDDYHDTGN